MGQANDDMAADDDIRVLMLTGAAQAFCASGDPTTLDGGGDPGKWVSSNTNDIRRSFEGTPRLILGLRRMGKLIISIINGTAMGAGLDLACACNLRIGSLRARLMVAYVRIGLFPGFGGTWLYPRTLVIWVKQQNCCSLGT